MTATLWIDTESEETVELGGTLPMYAAFSEMSHAAGGMDDYPALFGVPSATEDQADVDPEWLAEARQEAASFLEKYGTNLGGEAVAILETLVGEGSAGEEQVPAEKRLPRRRAAEVLRQVCRKAEGSTAKPCAGDLHLVEVPDVRQRNHFACGACAAACCGWHFGVGPGWELWRDHREDWQADDVEEKVWEAVEEWMKALGTDVQESTAPQAIIDYLRSLGLTVEARQGMTLDDLAAYAVRGIPVIVCVQDYGLDIPDEANFDYGHYLTVIGVGSGYVFCQDSSEDNVIAGNDDVPIRETGSAQKPGRIMVDEATWGLMWYDEDGDGNKYTHYGIAVGPKTEQPGPPPAKSRRRAADVLQRMRRKTEGEPCKPGETAARTDCKPASGEGGAADLDENGKVKPQEVDLARFEGRIRDWIKLWMKNEEDRAGVEATREKIRNGEPVEPVLIRDYGDGDLELLDGSHRAAAFILEGKTKIPAYVFTNEDQLPPEVLERWKHGGKPKAEAGNGSSGDGSAATEKPGGPALRDDQKAAAAKIHESLAAASHLSDEQKKTYGEAVNRVVSRMGPKATEHLAASVDRVEWFADTKALTEEFRKLGGHASGTTTINGFFRDRHKAAFLDGPTKKLKAPGMGGDQVNTHGTYAHELGHGVDLGNRFSAQKEWRQAFHAEIVGNENDPPRLSEYARLGKIAFEGFAEFARAVWGSDVPHDTLKARFPKCFAFFENNGLV